VQAGDSAEEKVNDLKRKAQTDSKEVKNRKLNKI